jgi:hypothetical protein
MVFPTLWKIEFPTFSWNSVFVNVFYGEEKDVSRDTKIKK